MIKKSFVIKETSMKTNAPETLKIELVGGLVVIEMDSRFAHNSMMLTRSETLELVKKLEEFASSAMDE